MVVELELDHDTLRANFKKYEPLLCDPCRERLTKAAAPLAAKLNAGARPTAADMIKLLGALCNKCSLRIGAERNRRVKA